MEPITALDAQLDLLRQCLAIENDFDAVMQTWRALRELEARVSHVRNLAADKADLMSRGPFVPPLAKRRDARA